MPWFEIVSMYLPNRRTTISSRGFTMKNPKSKIGGKMIEGITTSQSSMQASHEGLYQAWAVDSAGLLPSTWISHADPM
jgi:hypothetical protein